MFLILKLNLIDYSEFNATRIFEVLIFFVVNNTFSSCHRPLGVLQVYTLLQVYINLQFIWKRQIMNCPQFLIVDASHITLSAD